ncbi:MAG: tetratricopeptide repeat protein [bacterium]
MTAFSKTKSGNLLKKLIFVLSLSLIVAPAVLKAGESDDFNLLVKHFREKNFAMVKNLAKDLIDKPQYRYHVKVILSEVYFQENDFFYSKELLKEVLEEYPDKAEEIKKRVAKIEKEEQFLSRKSSESSKKFVIYWKEGKEKNEELVNRVNDIVNEAYTEAGRFFGWYPEDIVQIVLYYGSEYSDYTIFPLWSQGGYDGKLRIMIKKGIPEKLLRELIFHEYAHLVVQGVTKGRCPLWFNEAVAQYFAKKYGTGGGFNYERSELSYDAFPLNWSSLSEKEVEKLYRASLMTLLSIVQKSDETVVVTTLQGLGEGKTFEEAMNAALSIYGLKIEEFSKKGE